MVAVWFFNEKGYLEQKLAPNLKGIKNIYFARTDYGEIVFDNRAKYKDMQKELFNTPIVRKEK